MGDELIRREKHINNCKPAMIQEPLKWIKTINAEKGISSLDEKLAKLQAQWEALQGGQPAYAQNFALAA